MRYDVRAFNRIPPRTTPMIENPSWVRTFKKENILLPMIPPEYRVIIIVLNPVLGPSVAMNAVHVHPSAAKQKIVAIA